MSGLRVRAGKLVRAGIGCLRDRLDAMLQRPEGVTIGQLTKRFGIQPHSARAMISTARRRLGAISLADGRYRRKG